MSCTDSREYLDKKYLLPVTFESFSKAAKKRGYILYTVYREDTRSKSDNIRTPNCFCAP